MYPILTTERLLLKPPTKDDFDDMFAIRSNKELCAAMVGRPVKKTVDAYRAEFTLGQQNGNFFTIRLKENNKFIGFIDAEKFWRSKKAGTLSHVGFDIALLPEYWGKGLATEAMQKVVHFAFMGIKAPWLCANHIPINPAIAKLLLKCGFACHSANDKSEQHRYTKEDYLKNNLLTETDENIYDYKIRNSPYSYDNPIRVIDRVIYPDDVNVALCGQSVIAMLTGLSVADVAGIMHVDIPGQEVLPKYMEYTLNYYGIKTRGSWTKRVAIKQDTILPDICILLMQAPHWNYFSLYCNGIYYDPKVGIVDKLPDGVKPLSYVWEIYN